MDIACPNCAATYRVPDSLLAHGKALRCAACGEEWVPPPPAADDALPTEGQASVPARSAEEGATMSVAPPLVPPIAAAGSAPAAPRPAPPTTPPPLQHRNRLASRPPLIQLRPGRWLPLAWLASVACVLLALAGLVVFGDSIAAVWPPFGRVTALTGG